MNWSEFFSPRIHSDWKFSLDESGLGLIWIENLVRILSEWTGMNWIEPDSFWTNLYQTRFKSFFGCVWNDSETDFDKVPKYHMSLSSFYVMEFFLNWWATYKIRNIYLYVCVILYSWVVRKIKVLIDRVKYCINCYWYLLVFSSYFWIFSLNFKIISPCATELN